MFVIKTKMENVYKKCCILSNDRNEKKIKELILWLMQKQRSKPVFGISVRKRRSIVRIILNVEDEKTDSKSFKTVFSEMQQCVDENKHWLECWSSKMDDHDEKMKRDTKYIENHWHVHRLSHTVRHENQIILKCHKTRKKRKYKNQIK